MLKGFLQFVEIRTKITSLFSFLLGLAWIFSRGQPIRWDRTAVFFASMFLFDLTTTAINNYIDTRTNGQALPFRRGAALAVLLVLFAVSAALGVALALMTDVVVFLVGGVCFLCGVFYTWGPLPISRMPLGEIFSGFFYGLLIPFLLLYINLPEGTYLALGLSGSTLTLSLQLWPLLQLLLLSAAPACATANIMLANNICDLERDVAVKRYTLPYYLGRKGGLRLFALLYYAVYAAGAAMLLLRMVSPLYLLFFLTLIPVQRNIGRFFSVQDKGSTFGCSIQNFLIVMAADVLLVLLSR